MFDVDFGLGWVKYFGNNNHWNGMEMKALEYAHHQAQCPAGSGV